MRKKIKLVLSGSGTLYPIHVGAVIALMEEGYEITEVCGVSGGSIIAGALASGFNTPISLRRVFTQLHPSWDWNMFSLLRCGLIKGDKIKKQMQEIFITNMDNAHIPIHIVTSNLSKRQKQIFSSISHPKEKLCEIIRISMGFPGLFEYVLRDGDVMIDGGVYSNFPLEVFGDDENVIGIEISSNTIPKITNIFNFISALGDAMVVKSVTEEKEDQSKAKVIQLKTDLNNMNLSVTKEYIEQLIEFGHSETLKILKGN